MSHTLQQLQAAIRTDDPAAILAVLPEPPELLPLLFSLDAPERDSVLVAVLSTFATDEDRWELIEAAVMDTVAHHERGAFAAVVPYIPPSLLDETRSLIHQLPVGAAQQGMNEALEAQQGMNEALEAQVAMLGLSS